MSQAPGDGDVQCRDGDLNPLFALELNERPLMDSRDYVTLLNEAGGGAWQQVDNDNNNSVGFVTEVSDL